jgi:hypothetical protein
MWAPVDAQQTSLAPISTSSWAPKDFGYVLQQRPLLPADLIGGSEGGGHRSKAVKQNLAKGRSRLPETTSTCKALPHAIPPAVVGLLVGVVHRVVAGLPVLAEAGCS